MTVINHKNYAQPGFYVSGYYAGWMQGWYNNGRLPSSEIDFNTINQVIHFGLVPEADGSIDFLSNSILSTNSDSLIAAAHASGKTVLITIGGWGTDVAFRNATLPMRINLFVANIVSFVFTRGYDGVDIDWEVLESSDKDQFLELLRLLRSNFDLINKKLIITAAAAWQPSIIAEASQYLDQIHLMTYDLSGPWNGWFTWHNAPVYSGSYNFPSNNKPPPSVDKMVNDFISAGVPRQKIEIGIDFYGYIWKGGSGTNTGGVTEPRQSWTSYPEVIPNVPYYTIIEKYFKAESYNWDSEAQASYLSFDSLCNQNDMFISYDDERTCRAKIKYAQDKGLGGVFIWELGAGVLSASNSQPLLKSINEAAYKTISTPDVPVASYPSQITDTISLPVIISWFPSDRADSYRFQLADDLNFSQIIIDSTLSTATSLKLKSLPPDKNYYWRVNASNNSGTSNFSESVKFTASGSIISSPHLIVPPDKAKYISVDVTFKWNSLAGARTYFLQIGPTNDFCNQTSGITINNDTSYSTTLDYDKIYYWRVKAVPGNGSYSSSDFSETRSFITSSPLPGVPVLISPVNGSVKNSIHPRFNWSSASNAKYYQLQLSYDAGFPSYLIDSTNITQNYLKVKNLKPNTNYFWRVRSANNGGISGWSATSTFATADTGDLSMLDGSGVTTFTLNQNYPNPFNSSTTVTFGLPTNCFVNLIVYDLLGREIKILISQKLEKGLYEVPVNLQRSTASGLYIYTLEATPVKYGRYKPFFTGKKMLLLR